MTWKNKLICGDNIKVINSLCNNVADNLERKWIACDINKKSIEITQDRLNKNVLCSPYEVIIK